MQMETSMSSITMSAVQYIRHESGEVDVLSETTDGVMF